MCFVMCNGVILAIEVSGCLKEVGECLALKLNQSIVNINNTLLS